MLSAKSGAVLLGLVLLAGCAAPNVPAVDMPAPVATPVVPVVVEAPRPAADPALVAFYAARSDGDHTMRSIDPGNFNPEYLRSEVDFASDEAPGTIVIDTPTRHLFLVEGNGKALRYGVAIGREGFGWTGEGTIERNARWPKWTPPPEMIARDPHVAKWKEGQPGGPTNPLGARALYIYFGSADSGYRIHGTNDPRSIGHSASSGCFRMLNQDVVELYGRVHRGTRVIVR